MEKKPKRNSKRMGRGSEGGRLFSLWVVCVGVVITALKRSGYFDRILRVSMAFATTHEWPFHICNNTECSHRGAISAHACVCSQNPYRRERGELVHYTLLLRWISKFSSIFCKQFYSFQSFFFCRTEGGEGIPTSAPFCSCSNNDGHGWSIEALGLGRGYHIG